MKIAYIAASSIPSSTANSIQVMKVCQALTQLGHEAYLLIPGHGEMNWHDLLHLYGIATQFSITLIPSAKGLKRFDFILGALRQAKIKRAQVVYTRMLWVAVLAQIQNIPVILELHDIPAGRLGRPLFYKYLHSNSKKTTVLITHALGKLIEERFKLKLTDNEIFIAPDGVDDSRYASLPDAAAARQKLGLDELPTAIYTGGFYRGRGLELLVKLAADFPGVQFLWVGGKPEAVTAWQATLNNQDIKNIKLTGFVPNQELPLYQAAADVLLMPFGKTVSGSSGGNTADVCSPLKMFEYMAAGRAILTSDLPVLREILNEKNAFFYAIEDYQDLKAKFEALLRDADLRTSLARQAQLDVRQYSWQARMFRIMVFFTEGR